MKVKIVQIALAETEDVSRSEYLDDKGRVWYDGGFTERYDEIEGTHKNRWVTEWKQVDLPDEPEI